jgi:DNA invertase Pin-like site-specific DNA recombinase
MKIGYIQLYIDDQNLDFQIESLTKYGCEKIFQDKADGISINQAGLEKALELVRPDDTFVVFKLEYLGKSIFKLIKTVKSLNDRGVELVCIKDSINSKTMGKTFLHVFNALAEYQNNFIRKRTKVGLKTARSRGRKGGRKPVSPENPKVLTAKKLYADKSMCIEDICKKLDISRSSLYRYLLL